MFINSKNYIDDIKTIASINIDWNNFTNKTILITGATGLIGTFLVDLLMYRNSNYNNNITVYALNRNKETAKKRFNQYFDSPFFVSIQSDLQTSFELNVSVDYIIHGASNAHPIAYATDPIGTIITSVLGTKYILDFAYKQNTIRTLFISTSEIYGENRGDTEFFKEDYCGYIDCNTLRAGYSEGKRTAEALCQSYKNKYDINFVIARCCRIFGSTMGDDDSRSTSQFIKKTVNFEDIILKSNGEQKYSCCYVPDLCSSLLFLLLNGENGEAYNISDFSSSLSLYEIANILTEYSGKKIIFDLPSSVEAIGYSKITKALLDSSKLQNLGWKPLYSIKDGLIRTVNILREIKNENN